MERNSNNLLGYGEKKILPVIFEKQKEIKVNYAIAKFRDNGIAFRTTKPANRMARCWIKSEDVIGENEFHLTLRFQGVDFKTGKGNDMFDIDLYLPLEEFNENFNKLIIDKSHKERLNAK
jgi:hypothetical protein